MSEGKEAREDCAARCWIESDSASARRGEGFSEVRKVAERFRKNTKTYGFSLGRCDVPGQRKQGDVEVPDGMVELGLGIHNEARI